MQTIYLLKDCIRSCNALFKLYKKPDISTNIIIVSKKQSKILLLDKRVREFPFIVNSLPTNIGLIPKYSRVLPLQLFITLKKKYNNLKKQKALPLFLDHLRLICIGLFLHEYNRDTHYSLASL